MLCGQRVEGVLQFEPGLGDLALLAPDVLLVDEHLLDVGLVGVDVHAGVLLYGRAAPILAGDRDVAQVQRRRDALQHVLVRHLRPNSCNK